MSKILLTGKNGQLGWELQRTLAPLGQVTAIDQEDLDLAQPDAIRAFIRDIRPDIIVNPAAYTAVDKAEAESGLAMAVNGIAPAVMAEEAKRLGALLVHYSTDYVFDGSKAAPYNEEDIPAPQSVYGKTKFAGEEAVRASNCDHLIFRTSWVYGVHGGNFMKTMLRLAGERDELRIITDQYGAPTWARLLAESTAQILVHWQQSGGDKSLCGLYHLTAGGRTSWHQYTEEIVRLARQYDAALAARTLKITPIATHEYPLPAKRPANSVLATGKIKQVFGIRLPDWQADVATCLRELYTASARPD